MEILGVGLFPFGLFKLKRRLGRTVRRMAELKGKQTLILYVSLNSTIYLGVACIVWLYLGESSNDAAAISNALKLSGKTITTDELELSVFELNTVVVIGNFANANKLGQGGFGFVYYFWGKYKLFMNNNCIFALHVNQVTCMVKFNVIDHL